MAGLAHTAAKRTGQFSLGMKQRLSLAVALRHEPSLLILDEPTNGLDPQGILDMRDLLISLNRDHGITILVSSHLLSEIERLVTHAGIINRGAMIFQGSFAALNEKRREASVTTIDTSDNVRAIEILTEGEWGVRLSRGKVIVPALPPDELRRINERLVLAGVGVHEIATRDTDLEEIFLELIGGEPCWRSPTAFAPNGSNSTAASPPGSSSATVCRTRHHLRCTNAPPRQPAGALPSRRLPGKTLVPELGIDVDHDAADVRQ